MREKELRVALVCYGGVSLAVYMHGITKEIWRLARASQNVHSSTMRAEEPGETEAVYAHLLRRIALEADTDIRILVDILAGASAGGINAVFLAHAMATGEARTVHAPEIPVQERIEQHDGQQHRHQRTKSRRRKHRGNPGADERCRKRSRCRPAHQLPVELYMPQETENRTGGARESGELAGPEQGGVRRRWKRSEQRR